ncbi:MAG: rhomboid family intramembrane serine protease [Pseudomonadota bacterium]
MHHPNADAPPFNPLPPLVIAIAVVMGAIEAAFQLGEAGLIGGPNAAAWRQEIAYRFGFFNAVAHQMYGLQSFPPDQVMRFVTYPFFHRDVTEALFSVVFVLAIGKWVGERTHWVNLLVTFVASSALTALVASLVFSVDYLLLGAWAPICGWIGAMTWLLVLHARAVGEPPRQAFGLVAALGVFQLVFWALFGATGLFEWAVGFVSGFAIFAFLQPTLYQGVGYWLDRARNR